MGDEILAYDEIVTIFWISGLALFFEFATKRPYE